MNDYYKNETHLSLGSTAIGNAITSSPLTYGLTADEVSDYNALRHEFSADREGVDAAKLALKASVEAKEASKKNLLVGTSRLAAKLYNNPAVTNEALVAAGLAPRDTTKTHHSPQEPRDLLAKPFANGMVQLSWNRAGNVKWMQFLVETRTEDGAWTSAMITSRTRVKLHGFTPGQTRWFRVLAIRDDQKSLPSNEASIYHGIELPLQAAA
jgi:hypothetical protein